MLILGVVLGILEPTCIQETGLSKILMWSKIPSPHGTLIISQINPTASRLTTTRYIRNATTALARSLKCQLLMYPPQPKLSRLRHITKSSPTVIAGELISRNIPDLVISDRSQHTIYDLSSMCGLHQLQ